MPTPEDLRAAMSLIDDHDYLEGIFESAHQHLTDAGVPSLNEDEEEFSLGERILWLRDERNHAMQGLLTQAKRENERLKQELTTAITANDSLRVEKRMAELASEVNQPALTATTDDLLANVDARWRQLHPEAPASEKPDLEPAGPGMQGAPSPCHVEDSPQPGPATFVLRCGEPQPKLGDWLFAGGLDTVTNEFTLYPAKPELVKNHPLQPDPVDHVTAADWAREHVTQTGTRSDPRKPVDQSDDWSEPTNGTRDLATGKTQYPTTTEADAARWPCPVEGAVFLGQCYSVDLWYRVKGGVPMVDWTDGISEWNWTEYYATGANTYRKEAWRRARERGLPITAEEVEAKRTAEAGDGVVPHPAVERLREWEMAKEQPGNRELNLGILELAARVDKIEKGDN